MDIEWLLTETCSTIDSFSQLLEQETAAAKALDLDQVKPICDRKTELGRRLDQLLTVLRQNKQALAALTDEQPDLKDLLVEKWNHFTELTVDNMKALKQAEDKTRRVLDLVVNITRQQQQQQAVAGYGRPNRHGVMSKTPSSLSVAVNTCL